MWCSWKTFFTDIKSWKNPFQNQRVYWGVVCLLGFFFLIIITLSIWTSLFIVHCGLGICLFACVYTGKIYLFKQSGFFSDWYLEKWSVIPGIELKVKLSRKLQSKTSIQCHKPHYLLCTPINGLCLESNFVLVSHFAFLYLSSLKQLYLALL